MKKGAFTKWILKGLLKFLLIVIMTILAVLAWLGVMFWGLLSTGNLMYAWILGIVFVVAFILCGEVYTLLKRRKRLLLP